MKLEKKKSLAARALGVGENRILFNSERLSEIKEAITKQDIKDLHQAGAISIKEVKGRKTAKKRKTRRRAGSVRKKVKSTKREYITATRKARVYLSNLRDRNLISQENFKKLRSEVRARNFRSLSHLKERIAQIQESSK